MGDFSLEQFMKPYKTKRQQKIEEQKDVLGVCLVGKQMSAGSYQGVCSGSVVRGLLQFKEVRNKVFLIVSDNALSKKDLDNLRKSKSCHSIAEKYTLFFIDREDSSKLKTYNLHEVTSEEEEVTLDVGLVIIPIDHDARKLNKKSGILDYRPFPVNKQSKERNASLGNEICQIVEGNTSCFAVTTLDLEPTGENYLLRLPGKEIGFETLTDLQASIKDLHPCGAVILRKGEAVGVLNFVDDKIVPLYFATLQVFGYAGSIKNQVGDGDGNRTADPKKAVKTLGKQTLALDDVEESVNISSSETHQPTAENEMTPNESSSNKGKSPSADVNEIGGKGKGSKEQTSGDQKSLRVSIDKSLNELGSFNATTSKDSSQASGIQVDHNAGVTSKALPVVSGRSSYKPSFPAEIGGDKILGETNVRDNKTLASNKDSGLDEGNNQARSNAAKPVTSTFPALRDAASTSPSLAFCEEEANAKKLNRLPIEGGRAPALDTASQTEDIRGGEDRALLERASEQGEETEGGVTPPTVGEPPSKASPVVSGQPLYKRSFSAKIGGDKILDETNFRDNKTLPSNKDSGLDERNVAAKYEGNDQARRRATKPVTNTFPAPRDAAATPSLVASSEEEENTKKLNRLLTEGGAAALRKVFDDRHPPEQLQDHLKASQSTLKKLLDDKTLNEHQWLKLFPRDGATPESKNFDFFLLFILLTTISGLRNPPPMWRRSPPKRINTLAAQIARLRNFHDELYVGRTRINNTTFSSLWREISDVLVELGLKQTEIDSFKEPCAQRELLGRVDERKLVDIYSEMQAKVLQELEYFRKAVDAQSVSRTTTGSREVKDTASQTEDLLGSEGQPVLDTASQTEDLPGGENRALLERTSQQGEETEGDASPERLVSLPLQSIYDDPAERLVSLPLQSIYDDPAERRHFDENADLNTLHHILMVLFCTIISVGLRTLFWG